MVDQIDYDLHKARAARLRAEAVAAAWRRLGALLFERGSAATIPVASARKGNLQPAG